MKQKILLALGCVLLASGAWATDYTLTLYADGCDSPNTFICQEGQQLSVTAKAELSDHYFLRWSDGDTAAVRTITMNDNMTLTAYYLYIYKISVKANYSERGNVIGAGNYPADTTIQISATANYGYHFVRWNDGNTDNPRSILVAENKTYTAQFDKNRYDVVVASSDSALGSVSGSGTYDYLDRITLKATPEYGYKFIQWNDGNTTNPRTISLTQDTIFIASFDHDSGVCGNDLQWLYNDGLLTISGTGAMTNYTQSTQPWGKYVDDITSVVLPDGITTIGDYAFYDCSNRAFKTLVLPHSVETIGDYAFANCSRLTSATFGSELTEVGDYAFSGCSRISEMTCYAETTPDAYDNSFSGVNTAAYLYVPCSSKRAYTFDPYWGEFDIQCIGAETTTVTASTVEVVPGDNEAVFTWPTDNNAASYSLTITKDGIVFCTLTFNASGMLTNIAFAPGRDGASRTQSATTSAAGMSFTVTGLDGATAYAFLFETKNAASQVIASYNGNFATTGYVEPTPTDVEPVQIDVDTPVKVVRDGQILIQRGDRLYDLRGQEVK